MKTIKDYYKGPSVVELRNLCKQKGLPTNGSKDVLLSRLKDSNNTQSSIPDIFKQGSDREHVAPLLNKTKDNSSSAFFLQIKASNLSNYFSHGYIYPMALEESDIYKNENRAKDILSIFEDYIVVSKMPSNFESADVLVELIMNGIIVSEYENLGLFYIAEPIPVSRIKTIYFTTLEAQNTFASSIKTFPDSFIPNYLYKTFPSRSELGPYIDLDKINLPKNTALSFWKEKLDLFDKILGLFAFIKNSGVFYAERENKFEDHTTGFFSAINLINPISELANYKGTSFLRPLLYRDFDTSTTQRTIAKSVIERVYTNKTFDIKIAIEILETAFSNTLSKKEETSDIKELIELFKQLDKQVISYKGLLQKVILKNNLTANLPTLALLFLAKFPNKSRQNSDKQAVRNPFIENEFGFQMNVTEYVLGFLGLYYGYKNMTKEDTNLKFVDKNFEQFANSTQNIKFKLESYLDRFVIESAFQFAIKQNVLSDSFDFLNWDNNQIEYKPIVIPASIQYEYSDASFTVLGQRILSVQRLDKADKILTKIESQYLDKIEGSSYLITFIKKHIRFEKKALLEMLKQNKGGYPIDDLEKVIELDNKKK